MAIFPVFKLIIRLKIEFIGSQTIEFALVTWWAICLILELSSPNLIACFAAVVCILALFLPTSCEPSDTQTILQVILFKSWDWSNLECVWFACEIIRIVHKKILNGPFSSGAYSGFFSGVQCTRYYKHAREHCTPETGVISVKFACQDSIDMCDIFTPFPPKVEF